MNVEWTWTEREPTHFSPANASDRSNADFESGKGRERERDRIRRRCTIPISRVFFFSVSPPGEIAAVGKKETLP